MLHVATTNFMRLHECVFYSHNTTTTMIAMKFGITLLKLFCNIYLYLRLLENFGKNSFAAYSGADIKMNKSIVSYHFFLFQY